jgi:CHAT domain-containing protein/tetratricopeptide (TPR) repeat protein
MDGRLGMVAALAGLTAALLLSLGAWAADPLTPAEREQLQKKATELNREALQLYREGKIAEALAPARQALQIRQRLYPAAEYPDGHAELADSLTGLGALLRDMGEYGKALPHLEKALAMRQRLYPPEKFKDGHPHLAGSLQNLGLLLQDMGEYGKALPHLEKALAVRQRLYPPEKYKDGHPDLASSLNGLGLLLQDMGENVKALPYYEQALAMYQRLYPPEKYKDGHPDLAGCLNNLGALLDSMGEYGKALPCYEKALDMYQRLYPPDRYKDGHPDLANSLNNLGALLDSMGEHGKALPYYEKALDMRQRLYPPEVYKDGHPDLANSLNNLGTLLDSMGEYGKALSYHEQALAVRQRLYPPDRYKDGHPHLAQSLSNLGVLLHDMGEYGKALPYCEQALAMYQRLYPPDKFKDGHPHLAQSLSNLGVLLSDMGEYGKALPYLEKALDIHDRQAARETAGAPEVQALAFLRSVPRTRDGYVFVALQVSDEPVPNVYARVWPSRGLLLRLVARRHQAALLAASDNPEARQDWERLLEVRRQLNRLAVEPARDPKARDRRLAELTDELEQRERDLAKQLPQLERHRRLDALGPQDLVKALPPGTAFLDLVRYAHYAKARFAGYRYQAFVLAPGRDIRRIDLGVAKPIDDAIASWRRSIDRLEASRAPEKLKELVWDKLAADLPPGTRVVYLCPEGDLARLPWAALPGAKPGTVLLEDFAVAVVPCGPWLLEQLLYPQKDSPSPDTLAAIGAIDYGKPPVGAAPDYPPLAETSRELRRVLEAFGAGDDAGLRRAAATPAALRERLTKARYAHLATHGYFDQAGLTAERKRIKEQRKKWRFDAEQPTARVGLGSKHPLGYVGLALAGANDPASAPDGGTLTGLGIVDLPLENLRLCVLSACETGLGERTEGEGVSGLQRAFHVAGCPNVIGSLWKVDDAATAALMAQFYHELRVNKRSPLEALREAQRTVYRHPERIADLAGERGRPALEAAAKLGSAVSPVKPDEKAKTSPTKLWAAFVLSGVGTAK